MGSRLLPEPRVEGSVPPPPPAPLPPSEAADAAAAKAVASAAAAAARAEKEKERAAAVAAKNRAAEKERDEQLGRAILAANVKKTASGDNSAMLRADSARAHRPCPWRAPRQQPASRRAKASPRRRGSPRLARAARSRLPFPPPFERAGE